MLTEEQIQQVASEALPNVLAGLRREIQENALYHAKETAKKAVSDAVQEFITKEIVPEVHAALIESKDGIIAIAPALAKEMGEMLASALAASLAKKLETSWDRKKIFEAIIG